MSIAGPPPPPIKTPDEVQQEWIAAALGTTVQQLRHREWHRRARRAGWRARQRDRITQEYEAGVYYGA